MDDARETTIEALAAMYEELGTGRPEADRRQYPRVRAGNGLVATVGPMGGEGVRLEAAVWDLSRTGMAVVTKERVRAGDRVVVEFSLGGRPVRATCRVANCRRAGKGFVVGLEFERVERPAGGDLPGEMLDAGEVMLGAEAGHVKDVQERLRVAMG